MDYSDTDDWKGEHLIRVAPQVANRQKPEAYNGKGKKWRTGKLAPDVVALRNRLDEMFHEGCSVAQMIERTGRNESTVRSHLSFMGLSIRKRDRDRA